MQARVQREDLQWHFAARPSDIALPAGRSKIAAQMLGRGKASAQAMVEHSYSVINRQFGLIKIRSGGLVKITGRVWHALGAAQRNAVGLHHRGRNLLPGVSAKVQEGVASAVSWRG